MNFDDVNAQLRQHRCPDCGHRTLELRVRLRPQPLGEWSLAGYQSKVPAVEWPYVVCTTEHCGFVRAATYAPTEDRSTEYRPTT